MVTAFFHGQAFLRGPTHVPLQVQSWRHSPLKGEAGSLADHSELPMQIPQVQVQYAWLLLFYCGAARVNIHIRTIRPELTTEITQMHDEQIWHCFCRLLRIARDAVIVLLIGPVGLTPSKWFGRAILSGWDRLAGGGSA